MAADEPKNDAATGGLGVNHHLRKKIQHAVVSLPDMRREDADVAPRPAFGVLGRYSRRPVFALAMNPRGTAGSECLGGGPNYARSTHTSGQPGSTFRPTAMRLSIFRAICSLPPAPEATTLHFSAGSFAPLINAARTSFEAAIVAVIHAALCSAFPVHMNQSGDEVRLKPRHLRWRADFPADAASDSWHPLIYYFRKSYTNAQFTASKTRMHALSREFVPKTKRKY
jgi:hypothetical protein